MSAALALAAAAPAFMTFICAPNDQSRSQLSYIVSFEQDDDRIRKIVVLWPNGSQSHDRWKGRVLPTGFRLDAREQYSFSSFVLIWNPDNRNAGSLTHSSVISGGHIIMESENLATCKVRSEADQVEIAP